MQIHITPLRNRATADLSNLVCQVGTLPQFAMLVDVSALKTQMRAMENGLVMMETV